mmetsp:Transcript_16215/g.24004  ORF Transcript_16215/g.24004 Transcript_16215/m.24004 type:complete len:112 (-) Transcript_16215:422-757(-)
MPCFGLLPLLPFQDDYLEALEKFPDAVMLLDHDGRLVLHVALERAASASARTKGRRTSSTTKLLECISITPKVIQTPLHLFNESSLRTCSTYVACLSRIRSLDFIRFKWLA